MLAPFGSASDYANHGKRVVAGQRMMQAATGVFLGWTRAPIDSGAPTSGGLRDSRLADIGTQLQSALPFYVSLCGRTLARAHARAGDIRRGDQRLCRGPSGPDRDGLAKLQGGDKDWRRHRSRARSEEGLIHYRVLWGSLDCRVERSEPVVD